MMMVILWWLSWWWRWWLCLPVSERWWLWTCVHKRSIPKTGDLFTPDTPSPGALAILRPYPTNFQFAAPKIWIFLTGANRVGLSGCQTHLSGLSPFEGLEMNRIPRWRARILRAITPKARILGCQAKGNSNVQMSVSASLNLTMHDSNKRKLLLIFWSKLKESRISGKMVPANLFKVMIGIAF